MKHTTVLAMALVIMVLGMVLAPATLAEKNLDAMTAISPKNAVVSGMVYQDWDMDGEQDLDEPGLGGAIIALVNIKGEIVAEFETEFDGKFVFENLGAGAYILTEVDPMGYSSSTDNEITLVVGAGDVAEAEFGDMLMLGGTAPVAEESYRASASAIAEL